MTGSGVDWLHEAVERGRDALVTGEGKQQVYHEAREPGSRRSRGPLRDRNVRRPASDLVDDWGLETTYVDCPTGL